MTWDELADRLRRLDVSCIADADKAIRCLDPGIRRVAGEGRMVGRAVTVACRDDFLPVIDALHRAGPGDVLVVDGGGGRRALAGELFASECVRKGIAGMVVDGGVRDVAGIAATGLSVYARHVHPVSGTTRALDPVGVPVTCGGVAVEPGAVVFGDGDGVVVAGLDEIAALVPKAEAIFAAEARAMAAMRDGVSLTDLVTFAEHRAALAAGRDSSLAFA